MSRPSSLRGWTIAALAVSLGGLAPARAGESPVSNAGNQTVRFLRVYAPADRMDAWPRGDARYLPMDAAEFERLVKLADSTATGRSASLAAAVVRAEYEARLAGEYLVGGLASLDVVHRASAGVLLPLAPCGLAVGRAAWDRTPPEDAVVGLAADGKPAVLVDKPGRLRFDWSLHGRRNPAGELAFALELPASPVSRLVLILPDSAIPVSDQGVMTELAVAGPGLRRWQLELGGHARVGLRILPPDAVGQRRQATLVRQSLTYDFSPRGVEVSAELRLDSHNAPLGQVAVVVDSPLRLVAARYGESPVPWSAVPSADGRTSRIVLELPGSVEGSAGVLRLGAVTPLVTGQRWRLPGIRPEGVFWEEGTATLLMPKSLSLEQLFPIACRQTKAGPLPAPSSGETVELQYFQPDAAVEAVIANRGQELELASATTVDLAAGEASGRLTADLASREGECFELEADVAPRWMIDAVETVPPEAIADWSQDVPARRLTVNFGTALAPGVPIRLVISGRRLPTPVGERLGVADLELVRFRVGVLSRRLVQVRAVGSYQLKLTGDEDLGRLDPKGLDPAEVKRFAEPPRGLLFAIDSRAPRLGVALESQKPRYAAEIHLDAVAAAASLSESYAIRCIPENTFVERLRVHFSQPRAAAPAWSWAAEDNGLSATRRLTTEERTAAGLGPSGETWELLLRRPRSTPFVLRASRTAPREPETPISLASLPDATTQRATLAIRAADGELLQLKNQRLKPIPAESLPGEPSPATQAVFRYDAARSAGSSRETPALVLARAKEKPASARAAIWNCLVESRCEPSGTAEHLATYWIQNAGRQRVQLTLPPGAEARGVWVDRTLLPKPTPDASGAFAVDLPAGRKFPVVAVQFRTDGRGLESSGWIEPPVLGADLPTMAKHWIVWLPPDYELADSRCQSIQRPHLSWSQRWFGPLGQDACSPPFNPLSAEDWRQASGFAEDLASAKLAAERLLEHLALPSRGNWGNSAEQAVTWGQLLGNKSLGQGEIPLLIDAPALARLGLAPRTAVRSVSGEASRDLGAALLEQSNLAVLVHPNAIVLTSAAAVALYHEQLAPLDHAVLSQVLPGPLADSLCDAAERSTTYTAVDTWCAEPGESIAPFLAAPDTRDESNDHLGWTAHMIEPGNAPAALRIVRRSTILALSWAVFLLAAAASWWHAEGRRTSLLVALGLLAATALLMPEVYVPPVSAAILGILFGFAFHRVRPGNAGPNGSSARAERPSRAAGAIRAGLVALAIARAVGWNGPAWSQEVKPPGVPAGRTVLDRVFIPVDDRLQPTGGKYQVSEGLYRELYGQSAAALEQMQGWLITAATYRGALAWATPHETLRLADLTAVYDLRVFGRATRIRFPWTREGVSLVPGEATLDGRRVPIAWENDGRAFVLEVAEPGQYRFEFPLKPAATPSPPAGGFDLAVPGVATSTLELSLPPQSPDIEVPSALGTVVVDQLRQRVTAALGAANRLTVRWPERADFAGHAAPLEVEELLWLKVQPGSVALDARFKFKIPPGAPRRLQFAADPRFRLLPMARNASPLGEARILPGNPQTIQLEMGDAASNEVVVPMTFLLTGGSGIGKLRLPKLEAVGARVTRRWMAVSVDPALAYEEKADKPLEAVSASDFATAWGTTEARPQAAYRIARGEMPWSLATRPQEPRTSTKQTLALAFGPREADVLFDARLVTSMGYAFQHRLLAPRGMEIDKVSLLADGAERAARWSRDAAGTVTVFLTGPVTGPQQLSLRGRLPVPERGELPLPAIRVEGGEPATSQVQIFRRPAVLVQVVKRAGLVAVEDVAVEKDKLELGRLVGSFSATNGSAASLVLSPNEPQTTAVELIAPRREGKSWWLDVDCRLQVTGGTLDALRFEIPSSWSGPFDVSPAATAEVVRIADENRSELVVRPRLAIENAGRITIRGRLTVAPEERTSVPGITLLGVRSLQRFLALPTRFGLQRVSWETRDLEPVRLPQGLGPERLRPGAFQAYRVVGDRFQAALKLVERASASPRVSLADVHVAWQADGTLSGVAIFDLEPAGSTTCPLVLPAGCRLVQAFVSGLPAQAAPDGETRWRLPLGSDRLPQRIEVVFAGTAPEEAFGWGQLKVESPALGDLPVERTLWTVAGPSGHPCGEAEGAEAVAPTVLAMLRLKNVAAVIERAADRAAEEPAEDILRWYRPWARRLAAAEDAARHAIGSNQADEAARTAQAELGSLAQAQTRLARRLGATELLIQASNSQRIADEPAEVFRWSLDRRQPATLCTVKGKSPFVTVRYDRPDTRDFASRLAGAVVVAGAVLLALKKVPRTAWLGEPRRWLPAAIALAGLGWWLWLSPSILGLGIAGAGLWAAFRPRRPSDDASGSTVIELSVAGEGGKRGLAP
ncbi:MAG: hypothetical protein ACYC35_08595 [Pirellulales bacterium]